MIPAQVIDHAKPIEGEFEFVLCLTDAESYWKEFPRITRPQGKIGLIVRVQKPVDLQILHDKSLTVCLEGMFTRSTFQTADMEAQHRLLDEAAGVLLGHQPRHPEYQALAGRCQNVRFSATPTPMYWSRPSTSELPPPSVIMYSTSRTRSACRSATSAPGAPDPSSSEARRSS